MSLKDVLNRPPLVAKDCMMKPLLIFQMRCCGGCNFKLLWNNTSELILIILLHFKDNFVLSTVI